MIIFALLEQFILTSLTQMFPAVRAHEFDIVFLQFAWNSPDIYGSIDKTKSYALWLLITTPIVYIKNQ